MLMTEQIQIKPKKGKLRIVCFNIYADHLIRIDELVRQDMYFSRSEIIRHATRRLLWSLVESGALLLPTGKYISPRKEQIVMYEELPTKLAISTKFQPLLIETVDIVVNMGFFESRSKLIRTALVEFLESRNFIHIKEKFSYGSNRYFEKEH